MGVASMLSFRHCRWTLFYSLSLCFGISACHNFLTDSPSDLLTRFPTPIYSLTGELLNGGPLGHPLCEDAQAAWLQRVDTNRDGSIDQDELSAESKRQFALMDLNHDGFITADELAVYRSQFDSHEEEAKNESQNRKGIYRLTAHPNGSQPDPVLSADSNLDFKVTLDEFLAFQIENLQHYDKDHDHTLDSHELNPLCRNRDKAATPTSR